MVRETDSECEVDLPRSAEKIARFVAQSPIPSEKEVDILAGLRHLVDRQGFKLVDFDRWKLRAQPLGGSPPDGGMLRLIVKF